MFRLILFHLCISFIICDPLDFLSEKEKEALGRMHILDLPEKAQHVIRSVTLHGNATWV
jgi:hypothetical protein